MGEPAKKLYIDIFLAREKDAHTIEYYYPFGGFPASKQPAYTCSKKAVLPTKTIELEGVTVNAPADII